MQSKEDFTRELFIEHLEEISFLYEQRQTMFTNPEITWLEIESFENRLTPHMDAIETAGEAEADYAVEYLAEEAEELCDIFAAVYSVLRLNEQYIPNLFKLLDRFKGEQLSGYFEGFRFFRNPVPSEKLIDLLKSESSEIICGAMRVLVDRRLVQAKHILHLLQSKDAEVIAATIEALGSLNSKESIPDIEPFTTHDDAQIRKNSLEALLRLQDIKTLNSALQSWDNSIDKVWLSSYIGLAGRCGDCRLLLPGKDEPIEANALEALGVLGSVSAIKTLLETLKNSKLNLLAGKALQMITGAGLTEKITIEEEDAFADSYDEGEESDPPETFETEQVSTSFDDWSNWWDGNKGNFNISLRYRYGQPFTPGLCIEEINSEKSRFEDRKRAYLELVISTGHDIPFEPDWFVARQRQSIKEWSEWWQEHKKNYTPGS